MFSDPVVGRDFFGRQEILDVLVKRAEALKGGYRQNVALIGHQQLGKTSILRQFLHTFNDPEVLSIYVEIKLQALDYFVDQFIRSLLYQFLKEKGPVDPTESLAGLSLKAEPYLPQTVARIREISTHLKSRKPEEAYVKLFELTHFVRLESGKFCIVVLDEFHRLGEFGIRNAFSDFGKRIMVQKDTMYLLSSSSFSASRKILAEKLALLFGNFERIYLEHFDFDTSRRLIASRLTPIQIPEAVESYLVAFTDGHPFLLQTLVSRIAEIARSSSLTKLSEEVVARAFEELLYESQGVLNQYFSKLISPWTSSASRGSHLLILTQLARGRNRLKDIATALNRSQREVSREISELMEYELVLKTGVFYRFHNKAFKFWLREVYEKKELSLLGASEKREAFRERMTATLRDYAELLRLDVGDRIACLFNAFQNDLVEFGEKKRQLPRFTETLKMDISQTPAGGTRKIIAKGHGRCWVCQIVDRRASESDVMNFVGGNRKNDAAQTRVMIALDGFDANAKLLAKERKVFALGLSRLNFLMDLYGLDPVVRMTEGYGNRAN